MEKKRKWKCTFVLDANKRFWTVGKIYESDSKGYNMVGDDGSIFNALSPDNKPRKIGGFMTTKFEEVGEVNKVKNPIFDRDEVIEKLDHYCNTTVCDICVFNKKEDDFDLMTDEELLIAYKQAFENKKEKKEEDKMKVGDRVKIKAGTEKNFWSSDGEMEKYVGTCGKIMVIENEKRAPFTVTLELDGQTWHFNKEDLEKPLEEEKTIIITVSNTITTLTDGEHVTVINRFHGDTHDESKAIFFVVEKYNKEKAQIEYEKNLPKVGEEVTVINSMKACPYYSDWLVENNIDVKHAIRWTYGRIPMDGGKYRVVAIHNYSKSNHGKLALIRDSKWCYIISVEALRVNR